MEATSVYIKKEIEDAEYERSYHYSSNDSLLNPVTHEEDYTVTVNPEAILDIKYEREEDPSSNDSESIAGYSSNVSALTGDNDAAKSPQPTESPTHNINRRKRKLHVRRRDVRQKEQSEEESEQAEVDNAVKSEPDMDEEFQTYWNGDDPNSYDGTSVKMESVDENFGSDSNYMENCSNGTTEIAPEDDFVIKTENVHNDSLSPTNQTRSSSKRKRKSLEENTEGFQNVPVGNLMSLQESEGEAANHTSSNDGKTSSEQTKRKTRKTWFLDADKGMWKRRSWYEEEAKNMMQKTQEDLKQIEELYSSKSGEQKKELYRSILQTPLKKPERKEQRRVVGKKRSRYEEKTELMKRKTVEDEEFIGSLKTMFKRPAESSEHSNQSIDSTSSATPPETGVSENSEKSAMLSTSLLTLTELSELNEKRKGSNKIPIEEDKWKELSKKSSEELEQEISDLNGKRRLTVPRKSMYEEKTRFMNRKTQEDEELIKGLQSLRKLVSKDSKEYKQLLNETSVLSDNIKEHVEIPAKTFEYQPGPGVPVKKFVLPAENSLTFLIPLKWEADEELGDAAEYAPVLYSNKNHTDLKEKIPQWTQRASMIAKIWRDLPEHTREAYKAQCKQNKLKREEDQKKRLEEVLKRHSGKKVKQSRTDHTYRATVPMQCNAPVRQSLRLISKSSNSSSVSDEVTDSSERSSSPGGGGSELRKSKYEEKAKMLTMKSERDKAMMAKANLPVPREGPPDRLPGSHYALSMQMMALKTQQEMATLAKLIPQEKVAALQSRQTMFPKELSFVVENEENPAPKIFIIDNGKAFHTRCNGNQICESPPVQQDVNLNQNSVFIVKKSGHNEEQEKSFMLEDSVLMCSECGEEFTSLSDMDSHKTLSHNYKPSVILPKEDTALPFIKFEPVDEDFNKIENSGTYAEETKERKRKGKGKGKMKVKKDKGGEKSSGETKSNFGTCDTDIKIKTEVT